jgi:histidinol dehydrogenase
MQIINHLEQDFETKINKIVSNNSEINTKTNEQVLKILNLVKNDGDKAIIEICNKFDNANFKNPQDLLVSQKEIDESIDKINPELLQALKLSYQRILSYHKKQLPEDFIYEDDIGVTLGNRWQAIESICVYAPGGSAIYPSSILMSAVPAITAGVKNITATIPSNNGKIADVVLAACKICNINQVYKIGGTAAIAAFAYGTKTIALL